MGELVEALRQADQALQRENYNLRLEETPLRRQLWETQDKVRRAERDRADALWAAQEWRREARRPLGPAASAGAAAHEAPAPTEAARPVPTPRTRRRRLLIGHVREAPGDRGSVRERKRERPRSVCPAGRGLPVSIRRYAGCHE